MSDMAYILIWASVAVLSAIVGFAAGWFLVGHRHVDRSAPAPLPADVEQLIQDSAAHWARTRGRPLLAPMIAAKLRLAYRLREDWTNRRGQP
jgi:hypothetical protein